MQLELTAAAIALVGFLVALFAHDFVSLGKNRRYLVLQAIVFAVGGTLILYPEIAQRLARAVGIGRGVDFVLYPLVIALVRESLLARRRRHEDEEKMTELVRAFAADRAHFARGADSVQSASLSASRTE